MFHRIVPELFHCSGTPTLQHSNSPAEADLSCILISSAIEEIIGMCTRVVVMREGRITGMLEGSDIQEEEIMLHTTGLRGKQQDR